MTPIRFIYGVFILAMAAYACFVLAKVAVHLLLKAWAGL